MQNVARETFVKNLRHFMECTGITQADICRKLNIASATVSNWYTGERYPRIDAIQGLAKIFGVDYTALISDNGFTDFKTKQMIETLRKNHDLQTLFDLMYNMPHEDILMILQIVKRISRENQ